MSKTVKSRCRVVKYNIDSEKLWKQKGPRGAASSTGSPHRGRDVQLPQWGYNTFNIRDLSVIVVESYNEQEACSPGWGDRRYKLQPEAGQGQMGLEGLAKVLVPTNLLPKGLMSHFLSSESPLPCQH